MVSREQPEWTMIRTGSPAGKYRSLSGTLMDGRKIILILGSKFSVSMTVI